MLIPRWRGRKAAGTVALWHWDVPPRLPHCHGCVWVPGAEGGAVPPPWGLVRLEIPF